MKVVSPESRFARPEWERRFLLHRFPEHASVTRVQQIADRYIVGTRLRLRRINSSHGGVGFKLTQKLDHGADGAFQGNLATIYLAEEEYNVFAALPARLLEKTRHSVHPSASTSSGETSRVSSWRRLSSVQPKKPRRSSLLDSFFGRSLPTQDSLEGLCLL